MLRFLPFLIPSSAPAGMNFSTSSASVIPCNSPEGSGPLFMWHLQREFCLSQFSRANFIATCLTSSGSNSCFSPQTLIISWFFWLLMLNIPIIYYFKLNNISSIFFGLNSCRISSRLYFFAMRRPSSHSLINSCRSSSQMYE